MASSSSSKGNIETKGNKGKRKIESKKVEQPNTRHVTFSKRKLGLFNKVSELSILCQAETALIVTSPNGKLYSCGYPNPDAVIRRFLTGGPPVGAGKIKEQEEKVETLRIEYEALQDQLKQETKNLEKITETQNNDPSFPWWDLPIEDMDLPTLENFKTSLEALKLNIVAVLEEKKYDLPPPQPLAAAPPSKLFNGSPLSECFGGQQVQACSGNNNFMVPSFGQHLQGSSSNTSFMVPDFGQYVQDSSSNTSFMVPSFEEGFSGNTSFMFPYLDQLGQGSSSNNSFMFPCQGFMNKQLG